MLGLFLEYQFCSSITNDSITTSDSGQSALILKRMKKTGFSVLLTAILLFFYTPNSGNDSHLAQKSYSYRITNKYPHDQMAFTEGLEMDRGYVYEGTGKHGRSSIRRVDLQSGKILFKIDNDYKIYGEGITLFKGKLYQLTWKNKRVFVYNMPDLTSSAEFEYPRQGWGLTHDSTNLISSDGSSTLYFLDPETLAVLRTITVHTQKREVPHLNELEFVKGKIYANIYQTDRIAIINPDNGFVEGWVELFGLRAQLPLESKPNVLNGIMYDTQKDRLLVTGKFWPTLFAIRLAPLSIN